MNIGIIVYSVTGNTLSVAEKLKDALSTRGHTAAVERVQSDPMQPSSKTAVRLTNAPDVSGYDAVVFATPVHGFSLPRVLSAYLGQIGTLTGKTVAGFVTQQLPKPWMGGNQAIRQLRRACADKGGDVTATGIVNWSGKARDKKIDAVVAAISSL